MSEKHPKCEWHGSATTAEQNLFEFMEQVETKSEELALSDPDVDPNLHGVVYAENVLRAAAQIFSEWKNSLELSEQIFLSYSRKDAKLADELYEVLTDEGLNIWMDEQSLRNGEKWKVGVNAALQYCRACLCVVTPHFLKSKACAYELKTAFSRKKEIFVALRSVEDEEFIKHFPEMKEIHFCRIDTTKEQGNLVRDLVKQFSAK